MASRKNKAKISNFLERIRNSKTALNRSVGNKGVTTSSVVVERDFFAAESEFSWIPERKRALKPVPMARVPVSMQVQGCEILVQIVGARNIPLREERDDNNNLNTSTNQGLDGTGACIGRTDYKGC